MKERTPRNKSEKTIDAGRTAAGKPDARQQSKRGGPVGETGNRKANENAEPNNRRHSR